MALLETQVYPGFPTDLQSVFMAVLAAARGESCIVENIFEDRFKTVSQLRKMGACIEVCGNRARITGSNLVGTRVEAMELRGGAALIDRFKTVSQLRKMGACIEVCGNRARITGSNLVGTRVEAMELRGGAALIIAGLAARGETYVENRNFIERGYEDICRDLKHMGARILKD